MKVARSSKLQKHPQSMASSSARLPPELCDMIIDHLHDDKNVLSKCTLVCHSWLRAARYHLFDRIELRLDKDKETFEKFLVYLKATPAVRMYIRDLCLDGYVDDEHPPDNIESTFFSALTSLLPMLHSVTVINCQWAVPKSSTTISRSPQVPVRSLYINSFVSEAESPRHKLRILRHFSHIGHLHLANVWLGHFGVDDEADDDSTAIASPMVKGMSLSMANVCLNFLEYLRLQPFMKTVISLRVIDLFHAEYLDEHQDLSFLGDLVRKEMRDTLKEFHLELPRLPSRDTADVYSRLNLSYCTALVNIFLRMPIRSEASIAEAAVTAQEDAATTQAAQAPADAPDAQTEPALPATADEGTQTDTASAVTPLAMFTEQEWRGPAIILSHLPPTVKSVCLDVELDGTEEAVRTHLRDVPDWSAIEDALLKLPSLERVSIRRVSENPPFMLPWSKAQHDTILRRLPALREKRLLTLHWPRNASV